VIVAQPRAVAIPVESDALKLIGLHDDGVAAEFLTGDHVYKSRFSKY
jgi:hypothetical protein